MLLNRWSRRTGYSAMPNDIAFADNSQLARNKTPKLRITPRVKSAITAMVNSGVAYNEAAAQAGLTTEAMRLALAKPHVISFYKQQLHVLRDAQRARNIHRLAEIRDADNNMPAVNAIKALEQIADEQTNNKQTTTPGVTIRIVNVSATPPQHEQTTIAAEADETTTSEI
jgi:hypothetical protein